MLNMQKKKLKESIFFCKSQSHCFPYHPSVLLREMTPMLIFV